MGMPCTEYSTTRILKFSEERDLCFYERSLRYSRYIRGAESPTTYPKDKVPMRVTVGLLVFIRKGD
jgi:hypothetical protein